MSHSLRQFEIICRRMFEGLARKHLLVPYPLDWRITHSANRGQQELEFRFSSRRGYCFTHQCDLNTEQVYRDRITFESILRQEYIDCYRRLDEELLRSARLRLFELHSYSYNDSCLHDELMNNMRNFHSTSHRFGYFSLRDIEAEEDYYQISFRDVERSTAFSEFDFSFRDVGYSIIPFSQPEPSDQFVDQRKEFIVSQIVEILIGREDPNLFEHRARRLARIEERRLDAERFNECYERVRSEQQFRNMYRFTYDLAPQPPEIIYSRWFDQSKEEQEEKEKRGEKLLKENLTERQLEVLNNHGYFIVKGGETGNLYRINIGVQMNVYQLTGNYPPEKAGICFIPAGNLVWGDVMLSQKIGLELHEKEVLKVANRFHVPSNAITGTVY